MRSQLFQWRNLAVLPRAFVANYMECGGKRSATPLWSQRAGLNQQKRPRPLANRPLQCHRIDHSRPAFLFGNWNQTALYFQPRHLAKRTPPKFARCVAKLARSQSGMNQFGNIFVQQKEFINRDAPTMTFLIALDTA